MKTKNETKKKKEKISSYYVVVASVMLGQIVYDVIEAIQTSEISSLEFWKMQAGIRIPMIVLFLLLPLSIQLIYNYFQKRFKKKTEGMSGLEAEHYRRRGDVIVQWVVGTVSVCLVVLYVVVQIV